MKIEISGQFNNKSNEVEITVVCGSELHKKGFKDNRTARSWAMDTAHRMMEEQYPS